MHEHFLAAALEQAWLGRGFCAPNPSVGAVVVHRGNIIAQAYHHGAGCAHAEKVALEQIPKYTKDLTLYTTLEPCNHWGKTPPCVDLILEHGVARVVYAYSDPNPIVVANNTPALLQAHGVEVLHYPMLAIDTFYASYRHWIVTRRPWITAKLAQSFDGKIAGKNGKRVQLSNEMCNALTHQQRYHSDILLTTAQTVMKDDPKLNARWNGKETAKPVMVLDRKGILDPKATLFTTALHCHIVYDPHQTKPKSIPNTTYHPLPAENNFNLKDIVNLLGGLGYHDVFIEAGGKLFSAFHQQQLVNRTLLYLVPQVLGEEAVSAYYDTDTLKEPSALSWKALEDNMLVTFDWGLSCLPE